MGIIPTKENMRLLNTTKMETSKLQQEIMGILQDNDEYPTRELIDLIFPKEHLTAHLYSIMHYALEKLEKAGVVEKRADIKIRTANRCGQGTHKPGKKINLWKKRQEIK